MSASGPLPAIETLIPHRGPMRLVEQVIEIGGDTIVAAALVPVAGPFVPDDGDPPGYLVIEMMAQSISAWDGWQRRQQGGAPEIGFLLGTRRFRCDRPTLAPGTRLRIAARLVFRDREMACFECQVWDGGPEAFAQATLNVYCAAQPIGLEAPS